MFAVTCHRSFCGVSDLFLSRSQDIITVTFEGLELTSSLLFLQVWEPKSSIFGLRTFRNIIAGRNLSLIGLKRKMVFFL